MSRSIAASVVTLGGLMHQGDCYIVPPFQRNYSWDEDQFGRFWSDIARVFDGSAPEYFLGSIVLDTSRAPDMSVIDGQQRIITTAVLISALRNHLKAAGLSALAVLVERDFLSKSDYQRQRFAPSLVLNRSDQAFYESYIFSSRPLSEIERLAGDDALPHSNRLIAACAVYMHRRIGDLLRGGQTLEVLAGTIIHALNHSVQIIRIDVSDDHNAFRLFETLNDRGLELSEADLLKNHLFAVAGDQLFDMQSNWDVMEQNLGAERVVRFIRHHWLSTRGSIGERGLYADIKASITAPDDATAYGQAACAASLLYAALSQPRHFVWAKFPPDQQPALTHGIETLAVLRPEQLNIMLLAALEVEPAAFLPLLKFALCFTFRYTTICNLSPATALTAYVAAARDIRATGRVAVAEMHAEHFARLMPDDAQFQSAFARKTVRSNQLARYILATINDHLNPAASLRTEVDPRATDLEHILPRSAFGRHERFVNSLGNMTLISARLNNSLGNADFATKKRVYARDCLAITRPLLDQPEWTVDEIKRRQNWFAGLAVSIWRGAPAGASPRAEQA